MQQRAKRKRRFLKRRPLITFLSVGLFLGGILFLWVATLKLPDVSTFGARVVSQSTKFYDRTGEIPLFNVYETVRRTEIPFADMSPYIKGATIAIEDSEFYEHYGIKPTAILRAVFVNATSLSFSQGGSTITQQVVKNALLTKEKSITRKIKEWVLSVKLERVLSKDQILSIYLNEAPYGGNLYGVEEASQAFFGVSAKDLSLSQAAYLAALPQAPTYFSPYGTHKKELDQRKDFILERMKSLDLVGDKEFERAKKDTVVFRPAARAGITAPHFVFFLRDYLGEKYGIKTLEEGGLSIITTLDADLQKKAEEIVRRYALENKERFNAENAGLTAIDPKTGQILAMVGSRDFFDKEIDGNFNITLAKRQPGSAFKPFVYATALKKGYTDKTVVFDAKTEFSARCSPDGKPLYPKAECYSPDNYDNKFRGPVTFREALAQSMNVPAVKVLYLAGINDSLKTARDMGITTLSDIDRYGLTLVLGGGEVKLLELTNAYGAFANDGVKNPYAGILKITDAEGGVVEEFEDGSSVGIDSGIARIISNILSDNAARAPLFGERSALFFEGREVAVKTGTTNDYRDAWVVGYTPSLVAGAWAGNNDNRPMEKKVAGQIVAPLWHEFMEYALSRTPNETFPSPASPENENLLPPVLRGIVEKVDGEVHDTLYWVDKDNPRSGRPANPDSDPQFSHWEYGVSQWITANGGVISSGGAVIGESAMEGVNGGSAAFVKNFPTEPHPFSRSVSFLVSGSGGSRVYAYLNGLLINSLFEPPFYISFNPKDFQKIIREQNIVRVILVGPTDGEQSEELPLLIDFSR